MKKRTVWVVKLLSHTLLMVLSVAIMACDDDSDPGATAEPEIFNIRYLSVEVTSLVEAKNITEITFNGDDLKTYSYAPSQTGSRRISCSSSTFIDSDDELVAQNATSVTLKTDADAIFDVVDLNGNITRFTPSITGASSTAIHEKGVVMTDEERNAYVIEVSKQVNKMPNQIFEIQ